MKRMTIHMPVTNKYLFARTVLPLSIVKYKLYS